VTESVQTAPIRTWDVGRTPRVLPCPLTPPGSATGSAASSAVVTRHVGHDGLYAIINNAGLNYAAPFEFADEARGREVMEVNLMAPFRIAQAFLPLLVRYNARNAVKARIINISSWAATLGQPFIPFDNASKFALSGLSESMFYDLGLLDVHVLASPGIMKTPMLGKAMRTGTESLAGVAAEGRARYQPLLEHFATFGASYSGSAMFQTAEHVAAKFLRVVEKKRPAYQQDLSPDACFVNRFQSRFAPWRLKTTMNRLTFRLTSPASAVA
jgi:NAD(P)-dependent dehydrogenase (short-subunit alcohol dehydrogenase family)